MIWTHTDTIALLKAARRTVGLVAYAEMVAWLAAFAIVWAFVERLA